MGWIGIGEFDVKLKDVMYVCMYVCKFVWHVCACIRGRGKNISSS